MKLNKDLILRKVAGEAVLVPSGKLAQSINGMITLNDVAAFIWEHIESTENIDQLVDLIVENFEIEKDIALQDALGFVNMMLANNFITME